MHYKKNLVVPDRSSDDPEIKNDCGAEMSAPLSSKPLLRSSSANSKSRRPKGSGSIYKRKIGGAVKYAAYVTRNGVREYANGLFDTKPEALKALEALKQSTPQAKKLMTMSQWVRHLLQEDFNHAHVWASSTWVSAESYLRNHIEPSRLGDIRIDQILKRDVQGFVDGLVSKGLKPPTVRRIGAVVSRCLSAALDAEFIAVNPAFRVRYPLIAETERRTMTISESAHLPDLAWNVRLKVMLWTKVESGMRNQEVCGLKWEYVDRENCCLRPRTALTMATGVLEEKELKEKRKGKAIPISPELLEAILTMPRRSQYVFTTASGYPVLMDNFERDLRKIRKVAAEKKINLDGLTLHGLRSSFATNHVRMGTDIKSNSEMMGHHKPSYTLDKYVKTDEVTKRAAQDKLTDKLREARAAEPEWLPQVERMVRGTGFEPVTPTVSL